ncbi:hypothetical protein M1N58_02350, partial [Dehalococcoidales bacterium]|nr:hypothetical protein [Dehalococcoidales bacterium]
RKGHRDHYLGHRLAEVVSNVFPHHPQKFDSLASRSGWGKNSLINNFRILAFIPFRSEPLTGFGLVYFSRMWVV